MPKSRKRGSGRNGGWVPNNATERRPPAETQSDLIIPIPQKTGSGRNRGRVPKETTESHAPAAPQGDSISPKSKNRGRRRNWAWVPTPERRTYEVLIESLPPEMRKMIAFDSARGEVVITTDEGHEQRFPSTPESLPDFVLFTESDAEGRTPSQMIERAKGRMGDVRCLLHAAKVIRESADIDVSLSYDWHKDEFTSKWPGVDEFRFTNQISVPRGLGMLEHEKASGAAPYLFMFTHPFGPMYWMLYHTALPNKRKHIGLNLHEDPCICMVLPQCAEDSIIPLFNMPNAREMMVEDVPHKELKKEFIEAFVPVIDTFPPALKLYARHFVGVKI